MSRYTKKTRIALVLGVILALIMSSMSISYAAAGTKTMTVYEVTVKGNYAYYAAHRAIYKVNLKTGSKKRIVKCGEYRDPAQLKIYKGYLYFTEWSDGLYASLNRVKLNGTNKKHLADNNGEEGLDYAISKGKIYYQYYDLEKERHVRKVMKLNGKNKKKSGYRIKMKYKRTNKPKRVKRVLVKKETEQMGDSGLTYTTYKYKDCYIYPSGKSVKIRTYYVSD